MSTRPKKCKIWLADPRLPRQNVRICGAPGSKLVFVRYANECIIQEVWDSFYGTRDDYKTLRLSAAELDDFLAFVKATDL